MIWTYKELTKEQRKKYRRIIREECNKTKGVHRIPFTNITGHHPSNNDNYEDFLCRVGDRLEAEMPELLED